MSVRKVVVGAVCGVTVLATMASHVREADAEPPKVAPVTPAAPKPFKRSPFRTASKPALAISSADRPKIRAALDRGHAEFLKDRNATKLMNGGVSLGLEADAVYRSAVADFLSSRPRLERARPRGSVGSAPPPVTAVESYGIESGDVVSSTMSNPCAGDMVLAFTIKNRNVQLPAGKTARLFANVVRMEAPSVVVSSTWMNLPTIANGATATVQLQPLRHRTPGSGSSCPGGDIVVSLGFVEVKSVEDYRLKIQLTETGADATLLSGRFLPVDFGSSGGVPGFGGGGGDGDDCGGVQRKCPSGVCAWFCPPCPAGMTEVDGGCQVGGGGPIGF